MAKKRNETRILREAAEITFKEELSLLQEQDTYDRPPQWNLSPRAVKQFVLGGELSNGVRITPKYFGQERIIELAIATLATDRALLLIGVPGTAKTWLSECLAAAISGKSSLIVQGNLGTHEESLTYGWNYAELLAHGPTNKAIVPSPILTAMKNGAIARIEELTRMSSDVQDCLIMLLSEKSLPVPELGINIPAIEGFNLIATANDRDKGIHRLSSALQRRFNTVYMPLPATLEEEIQIVTHEVKEFTVRWNLQAPKEAIEQIEQVLTIYRELRQGKTMSGDRVINKPTSTLSTAEAISTLISSITLSTHFGDGKIDNTYLVDAIIRTVIKDKEKDLPIWKEYLYNILQNKKELSEIYEIALESTQSYQ